jgi:hypothetical protein
MAFEPELNYFSNGDTLTRYGLIRPIREWLLHGILAATTLLAPKWDMQALHAEHASIAENCEACATTAERVRSRRPFGRDRWIDDVVWPIDSRTAGVTNVMQD